MIVDRYGEMRGKCRQQGMTSSIEQVERPNRGNKERKSSWFGLSD